MSYHHISKPLKYPNGKELSQSNVEELIIWVYLGEEGRPGGVSAFLYIVSHSCNIV